MIEVVLRDSPVKPLRVLCLGAHSDDIEIGCGGTLLKLAESAPLEVRWVVFSGNRQRADEASRSAEAFLEKAARTKIFLESHRDGFFPSKFCEIKEYFERLKGEFAPDLIFTHFRDDRHQDHRLISDLSWNTFRNHLILEYEIPKYDGDLQSPNSYVCLNEAFCRQKVRLLMKHFGSQRSKHWFCEDLFLGLLRIRGMECASPSGFAEAFYCRKLMLDLGNAENVTRAR
jgi:LmbE family N-acetylglucosaminyl deacetylase